MDRIIVKLAVDKILKIYSYMLLLKKKENICKFLHKHTHSIITNRITMLLNETTMLFSTHFVITTVQSSKIRSSKGASESLQILIQVKND